MTFVLHDFLEMWVIGVGAGARAVYWIGVGDGWCRGEGWMLSRGSRGRSGAEI